MVFALQYHTPPNNFTKSTLNTTIQHHNLSIDNYHIGTAMAMQSIAGKSIAHDAGKYTASSAVKSIARDAGKSYQITTLKDRRTKEHKNADDEQSSVHTRASSCLPLSNVHQASQACIYIIKHILIRTEKIKKHTPLMFLYNKKAKSQASKMQTLKEQMYVKLA